MSETDVKFVNDVFKKLKLKRTPESSQIYAFGYVEELKALVICFNVDQERAYIFKNILPYFYELMTMAPSRGRFFAERIKIHPDLYPFIRVKIPTELFLK